MRTTGAARPAILPCTSATPDSPLRSPSRPTIWNIPYRVGSFARAMTRATLRATGGTPAPAALTAAPLAAALFDLGCFFIES